MPQQARKSDIKTPRDADKQVLPPCSYSVAGWRMNETSDEEEQKMYRNNVNKDIYLL